MAKIIFSSEQEKFGESLRKSLKGCSVTTYSVATLVRELQVSTNFLKRGDLLLKNVIIPALQYTNKHTTNAHYELSYKLALSPYTGEWGGEVIFFKVEDSKSKGV